MHAIRGRPENAERHGAGHVARCTVERLMGDLSLRGVRRAKSPPTARTAPNQPCQKAFQRVQTERAVGRRHSPASGRYPLLCTHLLQVGLRGFHDRRVLAEDHRLADLHEPVHRPGPGRPGDGRLATKTPGGRDLTGPVHHSDQGVQYRSIRYGQALSECEAVTSVGSKEDSYDNALAEALNSLYKAELIRNQGPWEDIDAARGRHCRVGALVQHHSPSLRRRHAYPCRAPSRLGPRRQPEQPETITTSNHRHQINQPPQNPRLDTQPTSHLSRICRSWPIECLTNLSDQYT